METWLPVLGYEGRYEVSNFGRVRSLKRSKDGAPLVMALIWHTNNYYVVWLRRGAGHHKKHFVHRLVAMAFIPNPERHPVVNHKDTNRGNCHVSNLEWTTYSENTLHYYVNKRRRELIEEHGDEIDPDDIPFGEGKYVQVQAVGAKITV